MGGKKPLRRPLWPPTRATASNYYPLGLDGAGGAAKPLLRAPKKPAPLHGRLPAFSGAVDAFERARKCFLEWRYFFSIILSEFLKNRVALQLLVLTFFAENGHYTLLRIFLSSGSVVPYGTVSLGSAVVSGVVEVFAACMVLAVKLALPILAAELLGELGMGILMKAIPQINAFVINMELKIIIGLVLLLAFLTPINEFLLDVEKNMLDTLGGMLQVIAGAG